MYISTLYMVKDLHLFSHINNKSIRNKVVLGHGEMVFIEGKGTVIKHNKQGQKQIANVLFILRSSQNLLCIAQLLPNNFSFNFKESICTICVPLGFKVVKILFYLKGI